MTDESDWTREERIRYSRHFTLPEVGAAGQRRLKEARVLIVGAGGLGSPAALYLAAAGVGTIGLVDFDAVDLSNLQRQILHGTSAVGRPKLDSAADRLHDLNPHVQLERHAVRLSSENAMEIIGAFDLVLDGSDNFPTRYLVNDASVLLGKPNVYGAIFRFEGQVSLFGAQDGPCYRCLFAEPPAPEVVPNCAAGGVLGVVPGVIGSIQALEAVKWILGVGQALAGRLLLFDGLQLQFRELAIRKDPTCPVCGDAPTITGLIDYEAFCGASRLAAEGRETTPDRLHLQLERGDPLQLIDVREPHEWAICRLPGARLVPLGELPARLGELDPAVPVVTYCHTGVRSLHALAILAQAGFRSVQSLAGGVEGWARDVDPTMARY
jgi:adenylyltransferase/sulfurtransferase